LRTLTYFLASLCAILLVSLLFATPSASHTTVASINDFRWEVSNSSRENFNAAPLIDCNRVEGCWEKNLKPDKTHFSESNQDIYVWSYKYLPEGGSQYVTVLYVVENRPEKNTWDMMGLEYIDGHWDIGAYGIKTSYSGINTHVKLGWIKTQMEDEFPIVYGLRGEHWAITVQPIDKTTFTYQVVENYWK
jgi:hypothetical protein